MDHQPKFFENLSGAGKAIAVLTSGGDAQGSGSRRLLREHGENEGEGERRGAAGTVGSSAPAGEGEEPLEGGVRGRKEGPPRLAGRPCGKPGEQRGLLLGWCREATVRHMEGVETELWELFTGDCSGALVPLSVLAFDPAFLLSAFKR